MVRRTFSPARAWRHAVGVHLAPTLGLIQPLHMTETLAFGLLTFLGGLLIGHRMTLSRDRRKEFNEVAARIRVALKSRTQSPRPYFGTSGRIDGTDMELFLHLLSALSRRKFEQAWSRYEAECKNTNTDSLGGVSYKNPETVVEHLNEALNFASLR